MLGILGIAITIIFTIFAYKTAKSSGRNAGGWALITFGIGFGIQVVIPFIIGIIIAVVKMSRGKTPEQIINENEGFAGILNILTFSLSFISCFLILRYLSKTPKEDSFTTPPDPPETFN